MTTPQIAQGLAGLGRNGDSLLLHVTPDEVAGLQAIARANGTSLTTNPDTGMPEAFSLGGFFRSLAPTLAGIGVGMIPGMQGIGYGIAAGALTGAALNKKDPLMGAVTGGLGGFGGANLAANALNPAAAATADAATKAGTISDIAAVNSAGNIPSGFANANALNAGNTLGTADTISAFNDSAQLAYGSPNYINPDMAVNATAGNTIGSNLQQAASNVGADPMGFLSQNKMGVGMPLGMAALSGMEGPAPGMTQEEYEAEQRRKFNQPLNLNQDTGLRLAAQGGEMRLANGGAIAFANGGSIQTGGVMDLYQSNDSQPTFGGDQGYGLGRLNNLANQQSMTNAEVGRYARGGVPKLEDGGFVVPADVTFYLGNHNTEKGQQRLAQMYGGHPITGPGTGLSDSIPTSIEGKEPARVANGEVYIPRKAVEAHGGPEKFYKMMDKVRKQATGSTKQAKAA